MNLLKFLWDWNRAKIRKANPICSLVGHHYKYNFPIHSLPNKRICKFCYKKEKFSFKTYSWSDTFIDNRSDKELVNKWFKEY